MWALDADEAGPYGKGGRPPPNEDGNPAETLSDQVVRLKKPCEHDGDAVLRRHRSLSLFFSPYDP